MRTRALVGVMAAVAMTTLCASASADTYCVPAHAGCTGLDRTTLAAAVSDANATAAADDIALAPGTFAGGVTVGSYPIHIRGAGIGVTRIEGGGGLYAVGMDQPDSSIEDLTIHELPGGHATALSLTGRAQRVVVDQRDNASNAYAAVILREEASFEDGSALAPLDSAAADYGIAADSTGPMLVSSVVVQGRYAVTTSGPGPVTVRFARVTGNIGGVYAEAAQTLVEESTVTGAPVIANLTGGADILATVRHVTLNRTHAGVESDVSGETARMVISNTAVVGGDPDPETADLYLRSLSGATGILEADYSFFRSAHVTIAGAGTNTYTPGAHNLDGADAKLFDVVGGDLRLRFDSPLIDAGDPVPGGGEPMADLAGEFRAVNGRTDIGAYEYGRHTPTVSARSSRAAVLVGEPVTFSADTNDEDPNEFPDLTWVLDDGTTARGFSVTHAFATPGAHTATVTATDPAGLTATAPASVTVTAPILPRAALAPAFGFKKLKARKGVVRVRLSCPVVASDCTGRVELRLARKPKAKGLAAKTVVLGRAKYAIAHGTTRTIRVKLTKSARRRLRRARHGLNVKVVARPAGAAAKSRTVRLTGR
jgi:hypothetical protein